jgi:hypothetical protein
MLDTACPPMVRTLGQAGRTVEGGRRRPPLSCRRQILVPLPSLGGTGVDLGWVTGGPCQSTCG